MAGRAFSFFFIIIIRNYKCSFEFYLIDFCSLLLVTFTTTEIMLNASQSYTCINSEKYKCLCLKLTSMQINCSEVITSYDS